MPLSTAQLLILKRALRTVPAGTRMSEPVVAATAEEAGLTQEQVKKWVELVYEYYDTLEQMVHFLGAKRADTATRSIHVMAWHGTPAILEGVSGMHAWKCFEYFLDVEQGFCSLYMEAGAHITTNTLTDALERLGLASISWCAFSDDDIEVAATAIFRIRNTLFKNGCYMVLASGEYTDARMHQVLDALWAKEHQRIVALVADNID